MQRGNRPRVRPLCVRLSLASLLGFRLPVALLLTEEENRAEADRGHDHRGNEVRADEADDEEDTDDLPEAALPSDVAEAQPAGRGMAT